MVDVHRQPLRLARGLWRHRRGGCISCLLLAWRLPGGLNGAPVDLKTWADVGRNRLIVLLLLITTLQMSGPIRCFHLHGTFAGTADAGRAGRDRAGVRDLRRVRIRGHCDRDPLVDSWGSYRTSLLFMAALLAGASMAGRLAPDTLPIMATAAGIWGLGFASTNSMQQVRLVGAAPALAPASVSLNTSVIYVGQAIGSATGGLLFARDLLHGMGFVAVAFVASRAGDGPADPAAGTGSAN